MSGDIFVNMKNKKKATQEKEAWEELKSQMMWFISNAANIINRIEEMEKALSYLLSKDEAWMKANAELLNQQQAANETTENPLPEVV